MNKKCLVILLVLVLVVSGLSAKDSGFKLGGQVGWGFDIGKMKLEEEDSTTVKAKNNGFAFNLTGEYDFGKHWGVVANLGMMFAGKTTSVAEDGDYFMGTKLDERAGLYIDVALDAKYTCPIIEKFSVSGLAGLELVSGHLVKDESIMEAMALGTGPTFTDSDFYNVAFGLNLGVEGAYKITDKISVVGGVTGAWFFVNSFNSSKVVDSLEDEGNKVSGVTSFYIRPYVGATYSF